MLRVKICGVTRPEDARAASEAGCDAVGLIFVAGSPRHLDTHRARQVLSVLPAFVTPVGVFMDAAIPDIRAVAVSLGIRTVQLHGDEPTEYVKALAPLAVIKALPVRDATIYTRIRRWSDAGVAGILLDKPRSAEASAPEPMPWHLLAPEAIAENCGRTAPLILAGGLTPDNVTAAVHAVHPYGVDVASGVEARPGIKDHNLIQRFVRRARAAAETEAVG